MNATIEGTVAVAFTLSTAIDSDAYCVLTNTTSDLLPGGTGKNTIMVVVAAAADMTSGTNDAV